MASILVVEDEEGLATAMRDWLELEEYQVELVNDAETALLNLQSKVYDIIITDWGLPKMSGIDLCKQFRSMGGTTVVLMLTGKNEILDKKEGFDAGVDDYITKPCDLLELAMRVKALIRRAAPASSPIALTSKPTVKLENAAPGSIVFDRYEFLSELGRGAMGLVYKARHLHLNRLVAIKVMHPHLATHSSFMNRFNQEARALSSLDHPHIVRVLDFGISPEGQPFLIIDFLEGITLTEALEKEKRLPFQRVATMATQFCDALGYMHKKGIIHRDIKPSNIMLTLDDQGREVSKIFDFGVAKLTAKDGSPPAELTQAGEIFGSPLYMSPEQCKGTDIDLRSDIFAVGCVIYQALTGSMPFAGSTAVEVICNRLTKKPLPFSQTCPDLQLPELAEAILLKAMATEPESRYQSMDALKSDISLLLLPGL